MRQVIVYPGEDGYWVAECPSLPGCLSQGKTKEEAVVNIKEAICAYIAALDEDGLPVASSPAKAIPLLAASPKGVIMPPSGITQLRTREAW